MGRFKKGDDGSMKILELCIGFFVTILGTCFIGIVGGCELGLLSLAEMFFWCLLCLALAWSAIVLYENLSDIREKKERRKRSELKCFTYPYTDYKPNEKRSSDREYQSSKR